jgi:hypothetical protein
MSTLFPANWQSNLPSRQLDNSGKKVVEAHYYEELDA